MDKWNSWAKLLGTVLLATLFAGCSLSYSVKDPVPSSIDYGRNNVQPLTLTIIDKRTGNDSIFLVEDLGPGKMTEVENLKIENIQNPISYFAQQLEKELNARNIPIKCVVGRQADKGLTLLIDRYQISNKRISPFSPWEACHIFSGTIINEKKYPIKAYFYNGRIPVWSMNEVEKPCFTIPVSIIIKEVASKICREIFNLRSSNEKVKELTNMINSETVTAETDPYDRPFREVLELGYTNNPNAMEPLKKYAQDNDEFFSSCALSAMGVLGAESEIDFLMQRYRTGSFNDRYMAAKAIGDIDSKEALQILRNMKKDPGYKNETGLTQCLDLYAP